MKNLFIILIIFIFSCASKKSVENEENKNVVVSTNIPNSTIVDVNKENSNTQESYSFEDSLVFFIERTPCYGRCPVYVVKIYQSGFATYTGERFTDKIGDYTAKIKKEDIEKIITKAEGIDYFNLEEKYDKNVTDLPSTTTYINNEGKKKKVYNRVGAPEKLSEFESFIYQFIEKVEWKKVEKK